MKRETQKKARVLFLAALAVIFAIFVASVLKTDAFNRTRHHASFAGESLFYGDGSSFPGVTVRASARSSTWGKIFDFDNEGLTENNYEAHTYDFTVSNNTGDEVSEFTFTLTFRQDVFLASAWNGALVSHQNVDGRELVDTVPDLREFDPAAHQLETVTVDGESFIAMKSGDYLEYLPSSTMNAMEMPIEPYEGTTPGIILYVAIGESVEEASLELDYTFHRLLTDEPLFWISLGGLGLWLIALTILLITAAQIRSYNERHERDNEFIREFMETFTGFIDAKDPYTQGHSKRVAGYTRLIAKEMGFEGDELDRIYYVALLHDCGKMGVPDHILGKPGKLTPEEFEIIKTHTVRGGEILKSVKSLKGVQEGALYHHERYDGRGYPEGRAGEDIPRIARMICVADAFDAMNTTRVYRQKLTNEKIISEIETNKGKQFDPVFADILLKLIRTGKIQIGE